MALYVKFECATCENENCYGHSLHTAEKVCDGYKHTATNADRIRSMTDEELAEYLIADIEAEAIRRAGRYLTSGEINRAIADCLSWLKSPVEVDNG